MSEMSAEIHRRQLEDIADLAGMNVEELLEVLRPYPLKEWARVLRELLPEIVEMFGNAAAVLAVDYYNERRAIIIPPKDKSVPPFLATLAMLPKDVLDEGLEKSINGLIGKIFNQIAEGKLKHKNAENAEAVIEFLDDINEEQADKLKNELSDVVKMNVMDFSRKTVDHVVDVDPAPIEKRRSVNSGGCEWCKLLHAAGHIKEPKFKPLIPLGDETGHFHEGCRCTVDLAYGNVVPPLWYDEWYDDYRKAAGTTGTTEPNKIVVEMRRQAAQAELEKKQAAEN